MKWSCCLLLVLALHTVAARAEAPSAATMPATASVGVFRGYAAGEDDPQTAGFHKLLYEWVENGQKRQIAFSIFLPHGYGQGSGGQKPWPMLTFLAGLGDRGADPGMAMACGVPLEIGRSPELRQWMPMIVLTPQCPSDRVWEDPGMSQEILRLIDAVAGHFPVDRSRLYVTGFSTGGLGSWVVAADAPKVFAVTVPIVSREYQAEATAARLANSGTTCLVISGLNDPKSEPASQHMVTALRKHGVDAVYSPVPEGQHFIWAAYYREQAFYEFLLMHRRGGPVPAGRLTCEQLAAMYAARQQSSADQLSFEHWLQRCLDQLEPYWFVGNCAYIRGVGTVSDVLGKKNVFVTRPLSAEIPCRLQTTRQLANDKWTRLNLTVGHPKGGEWDLVVRVNEQEVNRVTINDETAPTGWFDVVVNLQTLAGKEARLQLVQQATRNADPAAYWAKVKLTETNPR